MEKISFYEEKVKQSEKRISELKKSFLLFIDLDENFMFSVEPEHRAYLQPFLNEINKLKEYNLAVLKSINGAHEIYNQFRADGLVDPKKPEEIVEVIQSTIHSYRSQIRIAGEKLEALKIIDPATLETIIPVEHKERANELKKVITSGIPGKIATLEDGIKRIEKLFDGLDVTIPAPGANLPRREQT